MTSKLDFDPYADDKPSGLDFDPYASTTQATPATAAIERPSGLVRRVAGDGLVTAGKAAMGLGESLVGLANIPTMGYAGKGLDALGFDPKLVHKTLGDMYSPEAKASLQNIEDADGYVGKVKAAIQNPLGTTHKVLESVPAMIAGGGIARKGLSMLPAGASAAKKALALGAGEGIIAAGSAAEGIRQQTEDGLLTGKQAGAALATGIGTGLIGAAGGRLAQTDVARRLGIVDPDAIVAGVGRAAGDVATPGIALRVASSAAIEGLLEEMPQSASEQAWQNVALDRPIMEGVPEAAGLGTVLGGVMGGGFGAISRPVAQPPIVPPPVQENVQQADAVRGNEIEVPAMPAADVVARAQSTLDKLNAKANGTPDTQVRDETGELRTVAGTMKQALTDQEKKARAWLTANIGNPEALAAKLGVKLADQTPAADPFDGYTINAELDAQSGLDPAKSWQRTEPRTLIDGAPLPDPNNGVLSKGVNIGAETGAIPTAPFPNAKPGDLANVGNILAQNAPAAEPVDPIPAARERLAGIAAAQGLDPAALANVDDAYFDGTESLDDTYLAGYVKTLYQEQGNGPAQEIAGPVSEQPGLAAVQGAGDLAAVPSAGQDQAGSGASQADGLPANAGERQSAVPGQPAGAQAQRVIDSRPWQAFRGGRRVESYSTENIRADAKNSIDNGYGVYVTSDTATADHYGSKSEGGSRHTLEISAPRHSLLDRDKPLSEQSPQIIAGLKASGLYEGNESTLGSGLYDRLVSENKKGGLSLARGSSVDAMKAANARLQAAGIRGLSYQARHIPGVTNTAEHYVIFDGADIRNTDQTNAGAQAEGVNPDAPGATLTNGFKRGEEPGKRYRVSSSNMGVSLEKRNDESGSASAFFIGKDGALIDGDTIARNNASNVDRLWTPPSDEARVEAESILDEMGKLQLSDPKRAALKDRLRDVVTGKGSSRNNPMPESEIDRAPVGAWVSGPSIPGVDKADTVRQVADVPIDQIDATEFTSDGKLVADKQADASRYAEAMRNGDQFPNARGSELPNGKIKLQDGHRRLAAAIANGQTTLRIAVNPMPATQPAATAPDIIEGQAERVATKPAASAPAPRPDTTEPPSAVAAPVAAVGQETAKANPFAESAPVVATGQDFTIMDNSAAKRGEFMVVNAQGRAVAAFEKNRDGSPKNIVQIDKDAESRELVARALNPAPAAAAPEAGSFTERRDAAVKASRDAGNKHLDTLPLDVDGMRGKAIAYVHDPKVKGVVRTVDNNGNVYVDWSDDYSAKKELASEVTEGKRKVMRSSLGRGDLKDYVLDNTPKPKPTPNEKAKAEVRAKKAAEAAKVDGFNVAIEDEIRPAGKKRERGFTSEASVTAQLAERGLNPDDYAVKQTKEGGYIGVRKAAAATKAEPADTTDAEVHADFRKRMADLSDRAFTAGDGKESGRISSSSMLWKAGDLDAARADEIVADTEKRVQRLEKKVARDPAPTNPVEAAMSERGMVKNGPMRWVTQGGKNADKDWREVIMDSDSQWVIYSGGRDTVRLASLDAVIAELDNPKAALYASAAARARVIEKKEEAPHRFANNAIFTADKYEEAKARLKAKLGTLNSGVDPELLVDGMMIAGTHIEAGARKFADYAKAMIEDLGEAVKPFLLSFYESVRHFPGASVEGMDDAAAAQRQFQALLTPADTAIDAVGEAKPGPRKRAKAKVSGGEIKLKDDYGTDQITGYPQEGDHREQGSALKDQFLRDTRGYLKAVADELEEAGFTPALDRKGKPMKAVSVNESGVAGSGDVYLHMLDQNGTGVYVHVSDTSLRGVVPTTSSGIAVMYRTTDGSHGKSGPNQWARTDLTAAELAATLQDLAAKRPWKADESRGPTPAGEREAPPAVEVTDAQGRVPMAMVSEVQNATGFIASTMTASGGIARFPSNAKLGDWTKVSGKGRDAVTTAVRIAEDGKATVTEFKGEADETGTTRTLDSGITTDNWTQATKALLSGLSDERPAITPEPAHNQAEEAPNAARELDSASTAAPAGASTDPVPETAGAGDVGVAPADSSESNGGGDRRPRGGRTGPRAGVGDDAGEVPVPARGKRRKPEPVQERSLFERLVGADDDAGPADAGRARVEPPQVDFTIEADLALGEGGAKTKYQRNVAAIRLLNTLEQEGRVATAEEQRTLALYVGWGGLAQAFDADNKDWTREHAELKGLLTPEEYEAAAQSTQYAHYTSREIIGGMYGAMSRLGFSGGRVLEAGGGVGNFIGLMPDALRTAGRFTLVERERIAAGIAKHLYPRQNVQLADFTLFGKGEDGYFDAVIGNPPFSRTALTDQSGRKHLSGLRIHNYFIAKSIDLLREGGILANVVSNGFMDSRDDRARAYIAGKAKFLGAIRLPNNAFAKNAGTEVTTDIVFFQKLPEKEWGGRAAKQDAARWLNSVPVADPKGGEKINTNAYFAANPHMMLGQWTKAGSMYGPDQPALIARPGQDTAALLARAIEQLPSGVWVPSSVARTAAMQSDLTQSLQDDVTVGEGGFYVRGGALWQRMPDRAGERVTRKLTADSPWTEKTKLGEKGVDRLTKAAELRGTLRALLAAEAKNDPVMGGLRATLNTQYDAFVKAHGLLNDSANLRALDDDPDGPLLAALENAYTPGMGAAAAKRDGVKPFKSTAKKAPIFSRRVIEDRPPVTRADSPADALNVSMAERGRIDAAYIGELLGADPEQVLSDMASGDKPLLFKDPASNEYVLRDDYLSGNVRKKLAQAKSAGMLTNAMELEKVIPEDVGAGKISARIGSPWVPASVFQDFATFLLGEGTRANMQFVPLTSSFSGDIQGGSDLAERSTYGTKDYPASKLLMALLNNREVKVTYKDSDGRTHTDKEATEEAKLKANDIRDKFQDWLFSDPERAEGLVRAYNDANNNYVTRQYDGSWLHFPGKVPDAIIKFRKHQRDFVARVLQDRTALADHVVGAGKTFSAIAAAMELKRTGLANKPMIVVPNHLVKQWAADFYRLYPGANILTANKKDFERANRRKFLARIATGDWDAVIIAHSSFGFIKPTAEFETRFNEQQIRLILDTVKQVEDGDGDESQKKRTVKQLQALQERLENRIKSLREKGIDDLLDFAQIGVDQLFIDEAHMFKNLMFSTKMQNIRGLGDAKGSQRAYDMLLKTREVMDRNGRDQGVVFLTGTPVSNSLAEMYHMMRYLMPTAMSEAGFDSFDAWANTYASIEDQLKPKTSGNGYKTVTSFGSFNNTFELLAMFDQVSDTVTMDDIKAAYREENGGKEFPLPALKTGRRQPIAMEKSEAQDAYMEEIGKRAAELEQRRGPPQKGEDNHLTLMSDARKAAMDIRMVDMDITEREKGGRIDRASDEIVTRYRKYEGVRGTQLVFADLGTPLKHAKKDLAEYEALRAEIAKGEDELVQARAALGDEDAIAIVQAADAAQEEMDAKGGDWLDGIKMALRGFSIYDDLRAALVEKGIPASQVAFIHDFNTDEQKAGLFRRVNAGEIRVVIGSTAKMGAGTNVQERLVALHHLDIPWRPSDVEQREGRIIRQGNLLAVEGSPIYTPNFEVEILAYVTKDTLDKNMWDIQEKKLRGINQLRTRQIEREIENSFDEMEMSASEMQAAATGNLDLLKEIQLRNDVQKLERKRRSFDAQKSDMVTRKRRAEDRIKALPAKIARGEALSAFTKTYTQALQAQMAAFKVTINGNAYTDAHAAGQVLREIVDAKETTEDGKERAAPISVAMNGTTYTARQKLADAFADIRGDADPVRFEVGGKALRRRGDAAKAIMSDLADAVADQKRVEVGKVGPFTVSVEGQPKGQEVEVILTAPNGDEQGNTVLLPQEVTESTLRPVAERVVGMAHTLVLQQPGVVAYQRNELARAQKDLADVEKAGALGNWPEQEKLDAARAAHKDVLARLKKADEDATKALAEAPAVLESVEEMDAAEDEPFYSATLRAVTEGKGAPKRGNAEVWKGWLDGAVRRGDMKQSERDWLGLDAWLNKQEKPVTREQLADFIRANEVQIQEVTLGGEDEGERGFDPDELELTTVNEDYDEDQRIATFELDNSETSERFIVSDFEGDDPTMTIQGARGRLVYSGPRIEDYEGFIRDFIIKETAPEAAPDTSGPTKFATYQLPGGENYRELLLTLPGNDDKTSLPPGFVVKPGEIRKFEVYGADHPERGRYSHGETEAEAIRNFWMVHPPKDEYRSSHYDQPNILAHVRYNERTDADGKRVLFIEEIQSDWHQAGRKRGYGGTRVQFVVEYNGKQDSLQPSREAAERYIARRPRPDGFTIREQEVADTINSVPDAPFKATDEWAMLAFKRMVRHAAENGFDRIAWTTGEQQAGRYDLSKHLSEVMVAKREGDGLYVVTGKGVDGRQALATGGITADKLAETIGKELAERAIADVESGAAKPAGWNGKVASYAGLDLKVGGDGMRGFYDKILPSAVNKWAKRFGGKVGTTKIGGDPDAGLYAQQNYSTGNWEVVDPRGRAVSQHRSRNEAEVAATAAAGSEQHSIDLTPQMRDAALQGLPLFQQEVSEVPATDLTPSERAVYERSQVDRAGLSAKVSQEKGQADAEASGLAQLVKRVLGRAGVPIHYLRGDAGLYAIANEGYIAQLKDEQRRRGQTKKGLTTHGLYLRPQDTKNGKAAAVVFTHVPGDNVLKVFTAAHEIAGHHGLRGLLGKDLEAVLDLARQNPTVRKVADSMFRGRDMAGKIAAGKMTPRQAELLATEEALADLAAANATGNWTRIEEKHGVTPSLEMRNKFAAMLANVVRKIKALFKARNVGFSDAQVQQLLGNAFKAAQGQSASMSVVGANGALEQVVFHGTPHTVDKFSLNKIGTGNGTNTWGYGLYFSSSEIVASRHRTNQHRSVGRVDGDGNLYLVEIPDDTDLLDSEAKMPEQPVKVRNALSAIAKDSTIVKELRRFGVFSFDDANGTQLYTAIRVAKSPRMDQKVASDMLSAAGVPGLRFTDHTGVVNYVIWSEDAIGQPQSALESTEDQTQSEAFKRWFGKSAVVDADGKPLVVYHASTFGNFDTFDKAKQAKGMAGFGFYFTDREGSNIYTDYGQNFQADRDWQGNPKRVNVTPVFLRMENPLVVDDIAKVSAKYGKRDPGAFGQGREYAGLSVDAQTAIQRDGFDGVIATEHVKRAKDGSYKVVEPGTKGAIAHPVYVVFEPTQVKSSLANNGNFDPSNPSILESVEDFTLSDNPTLDEVRIPGEVRLDPIYKAGFKGVLQRLGQKFADVKPHLLATVPLNHLVDFAPKGVPAIKQYIDIQYQMQAFRNKLYTKYDKVAQDLLKFSAEGKGVRGWFGMTVSEQGRNLFSLMHDSTIAGIDPTADGYPDEKVTQFEALKARYNALPEEGQRLYRETRDAYKAQSDLLDQTISNNFRRAMEITQTRAERAHKVKLQEIDESGKPDDEKINLRKQAASAYKDQVAALEKSAMSRLMALREMLESQRVQQPYFPLKRYGKHWVTVLDKSGTMVGFSKFQTTAEQEAFSKEMQAKGYTAILKFEDGDSQARDMIDPEFAARVEEILQGAEVPDAVKDEVWQAYLERMPDMSMRKSFIHRQNVPGYHFDALKAFGSAQFHGSYQIARLKYGMELQETIDLAKEQTKPLRQTKPKDAIDADKLIGEIEKRHAFVMNPKGGVAAQVVTTAAFLYSLGANPAHLFLNATQTIMLGVPVLGSRYGFKRTAAALGRAVADFTQGKGHLDKASLSADDRKAFNAFMDSGLIDKTQAHDLAGVGETGVEYSAVRQKVMNKIGWFFHQSERFNREVTAMAAYRLARADGKNHETAVAQAINYTYTIHFDYSAASRARFMQGDTAKALLVFRNYNVNLLYRLFRDIHDSLRGESPQVKREARKQLGAMMGMYGLFAGTMGMPFYGLAMALAGLGDDDDDPVTAEQQFVNGTVEFLGPTAASVLLRGLPGTAFDIDLTERIGMPNLWFRSPQQEMEGRDSYYYWMEQLLGAGVGPVKGTIDGFNLIMEGQIQRGLERAMPAALRNPMQAIRQAQEGGVTSLDGDLIKETTGGDYIAKALGFQPLSVSEQYDKNSNLKNADRRLSNRREKLLNQYFLAMQMGDDTAEVLADVQAFNLKNPEYAITRDTFKRSARLRNRNKLMSENGIVMTRRMRRLQERTQDDTTE